MGDVRTFPKMGQQGFQHIERSPYEVISEYRDFVNAVIRLRCGPNLQHIQRLHSMGNEAVRVAERFVCLADEMSEEELDDGK